MSFNLHRGSALCPSLAFHVHGADAPLVTTLQEALVISFPWTFVNVTALTSNCGVSEYMLTKSEPLEHPGNWVRKFFPVSSPPKIQSHHSNSSVIIWEPLCHLSPALSKFTSYHLFLSFILNSSIFASSAQLSPVPSLCLTILLQPSKSKRLIFHSLSRSALSTQMPLFTTFPPLRAL